jgi:altronate hydrolase
MSVCNWKVNECTRASLLENSLAYELLPQGRMLTDKVGNEINCLLNIDYLMPKGSTQLSKGSYRKLIESTETHHTLAFSCEIEERETGSSALLMSPRNQLAVKRPFMLGYWSNEFATSLTTLPVKSGAFDALAISHPPNDLSGQTINQLKDQYHFRFVGINATKEFCSQTYKHDDILSTIDFVSYSALAALTDLAGFSALLKSAAQFKVPVVCKIESEELLLYSTERLSQIVTGWLRGYSHITIGGTPLLPERSSDRKSVIQLCQISELGQEYGENLLEVSLKLPQLFQNTSFVINALGPSDISRFRLAKNASPALAFWSALEEKGIANALPAPRSDIGRESFRASKSSLIRLNDDDNSAFATRNLTSEELIHLDAQSCAFKVHEHTPIGHLVLLDPVRQGEGVRCYGQTIGVAAHDLYRGQRISSENLVALPLLKDPLRNVIGFAKTSITQGDPIFRGEVDHELPLSISTEGWRPPPTDWKPQIIGFENEFMGYRRASGRVGLRQYIAIVSQVGCTEAMTESYIPKIRVELKDRYPEIDVVVVSHGFGCSHTENATSILPLLVNRLAANDNVGAVIWMGLGCQQLQQDNLIQLTDSLAVSEKKPERWIVAQNEKNEFYTLRKSVLALAEQLAEQTRQKFSVSDLMCFVECGGSDGLSGVTANPLVGRVSRLLAAQGATILIGETTELPAEHFLQWSESESVAHACLSAKVSYNRYLAAFGGDERFNPVRGNKEGGISTALHKALGSAQKIAGIPIRECVPYGGLATRNLAGVSFVDATSNDPRSVTARVMAGATLGFFTSGRMTPWGSSIAPTIKISTNSARARLKADWVDFDAGRMISEGASIDDLTQELYRLTLRVANGAITQSERLGTTGIELWLPGTGFQ